MSWVQRTYQKTKMFSVVIRYFLYVLPLGSLLAIPIICGVTVAPKAQIGGVRIVWFFIWVEVVWLSLWISKLMAKLIPPIFRLICGVISPGVRKYALTINLLEIPLSV